jgi:YD repeat-containing protein
MSSFATKSVDYGSPFTQRIDNSGGSGGTLALYIGEADPGYSVASARWRIKKLTYDASDNVSAIEWASGNLNFDKVWNSRTTYAYS